MRWRALAFDPGTFGAELFGLCRAVPYLDHLLCWVEETHDPVRSEDRVLRNYHRDIARHGGFEMRLEGTGTVLRSGRSVMLEDKTVFFGVQGRPDLMLAGSRVGFAHPLTAVVLPQRQVVIHVHGAAWAVGAAQAERAVSLFAAHRAGWGDTLDRDRPTPLLVTGDGNYAHHMWNQLGAIDALLERGGTVEIAATHQPIAPLREIFADPALRIRAIAAADLPKLDPLRVMPFPAGGKVVMAAVRERIARIAERRASPARRGFIARMREQSRAPIWLSVRMDRTALNQFDALTELACALLAEGRFAIVLDGFSRPNDYAVNADYDKRVVERSISRELAFAQAFAMAIEQRLGAGALDAVHPAIGCDLLDSLYLAGRCGGYFANHGTLQHKIGYFTKVPGMVHGNPGILATDRAATLLYDVIEDPGAVVYVDGSLVADAPPPGGAPLQHTNSYRFTDIPRLISAFRDFLARHGVGS